MTDKPETTKNLTSILPIGFDGKTTAMATEEDKQRMKAWGESMNKSQTTEDKSFDAHVFAELKLLVSDLENECEPSNIVLYEMIRERLWNHWLNKTYP